MSSLHKIDIGLDSLFDEVAAGRRVEYRDPYAAPYGDPNRTTVTQALAWELQHKKYDKKYLVKGRRPQILTAIIGAKGSGKALAHGEPVLTPTGWVPIEQIQVNDFVIGADGMPTKVVGVFPQGVREIYSVTMNDGTVCAVDGEHLWAVATGSDIHRNRAYRTMTTNEIKADLFTKSGYSKWYLPEVKPVQYAPAAPMPVDPYSLGALLGDGGLSGHSIRFSSTDKVIVDRVAGSCLVDAVYRSGHDYGFTTPQGQCNLLLENLHRLGLMGHKNYTKFVPKQYLTASVQDRIELLRGLMDTDGTVTSAGTGSFCTVSKQLAEDFLELVRSLGGVTKITSKKTSSAHGIAYRVRVSLPINPFWIARKAEKYNPNATQGRVRAIRSIKPAGESLATCIRVDNEDSLFLTRNFTPTHNTAHGARFAAYQMQHYPGSMGCIISNTFPQAKDNAGPALMEVCKMLGYEIEYFKEKKILGRPFTSLFVVTLAKGVYCYVLLRSYNAVGELEGIEVDWVWSEEGQDAEPEEFDIIWSRNRGKGGSNDFFYAGMSDDESNWQYEKLVSVGFIEADKYDGMPIKHETVNPETGETMVGWTDGCMWEPTIFENAKNLPPTYIPGIMASYDEHMANRYVYGKRTSLNSNRVFYNYDSELHKNNESAKLLSDYDPHVDLICVFDFNVYPMSCATFQVKHHEGRPMGQQVGEFEAFDGGTRAMMDLLVDEYADKHQVRAVFIGDATGNRKQSSATKTDWDIIAHASTKFKHPVIVRGLISSTDVKKGKVNYTNPYNRDAIDAANRMLRDIHGVHHVQFLPESKLESKSGGLAAAVADLKQKPDGTFDASAEKKLDQKTIRTHFADIFKYFAYWLAVVSNHHKDGDPGEGNIVPRTGAPRLRDAFDKPEPGPDSGMMFGSNEGSGFSFQ